MREGMTDRDEGALLDVALLLRQIHGNEAALQRIVDAMRGQVERQRAVMATALAVGDWGQLAAAAHVLKGSLANFGHGAAWRCAGAVEAAARATSSEEAAGPCREAHQRLTALLDRVVVELDEARHGR